MEEGAHGELLTLGRLYQQRFRERTPGFAALEVGELPKDNIPPPELAGGCGRSG